MDFNIAETQSIQEIQESFSLLYPFLKIEFLRKGYDNKKPGPQHPIYAPDIRIKNIDNHFREGTLEIDDAMTVSQLESGFFDRFGLNLYISRKSGNLWLPITKTKHWTLKQQNDQGREILPS